MKIALVTPWPPQASGIADYAYDMAAYWAQSGRTVDVYTEEPNPTALAGVRVDTVPCHTIPALDRYDTIVYQMGNQFFHLFMLPILIRFGGTVHLHDIVLHDFLRALLVRDQLVESYFDLVEKWYGGIARAAVTDLWRTPVDLSSSPLITELPLFEEVLQYADSCVVHSRFAEQRIAAVFPGLPCLCVPQAYPKLAPASGGGPVLRIGIFGGVEPTKKVDVVLEALAMVAHEGLDFTVDIAGAIAPTMASLPELIAKLGLSSRVNLHGRVSTEEFHTLMAHSDVCVALRYPTRGETSAVIVRALQRGLAVVVSDVGWYSELPDFVIKIPPESGAAAKLAGQISNLIIQPGRLGGLRRQALDYAASHLDFANCMDRYAAFLQQRSK